MKWSTYPVRDFDHFQKDWQNLNQKSVNQPIMDSDFISTLINHFLRGDEVLAVGRIEGEIASMGVFRRIRPFHWTTAMPSQAPLGLWLRRGHELRSQEISALAKALPGPVLMLDFLQVDSDSLSLETPGHIVVQPYIETGRLQIPASYSEWFQSLSKNTRQNHKRIVNKAAADGLAIDIRCVTEAKEVAAAVKRYGELEALSWKAEHGTAIEPSNPQGVFYTEMLEKMSASGKACCWIYSINGTAAAIDLCINRGPTLVILKTTYDQSFRQYSPAMQLKFAMIEHYSHAREPVQRIEFYGKAMDWHRKLTDDIRHIYHLTWFRNLFLKRTYTQLRSLKENTSRNQGRTST